MGQKMLQSRVRRIWRHLIEIVRHEGENKYLEGSHGYYAEVETPLQLPITLRDDLFCYYNLSALEHDNTPSEYRWKDFWPDTDGEGDDEGRGVDGEDELDNEDFPGEDEMYCDTDNEGAESDDQMENEEYAGEKNDRVDMGDDKMNIDDDENEYDWAKHTDDNNFRKKIKLFLDKKNS